MKNPLNKRLPKELTGEIGKYLIIFLFMVGTIGFISGFLIADDSIVSTYNKGFEKYNVEDGNFELEEKADPQLIKRIYKTSKVNIYENHYLEQPVKRKKEGKDKGTLRIFKDREKVNLVCVMSGTLPKSSKEIAIDRMYAENNKFKVGDTILVGSKRLKISGLVALSDYSALFSNNSDMMFDSVKFGVAIMTNEGIGQFNTDKITYNYAWKYSKRPKNDVKAKERSDQFLESLLKQCQIKNYTPQYVNQSIHYAGNDLGADRSMVLTLLYVLIVIIAFVFAVTTSNTISKEATVIGTLRASGYTKGELIRHYLTLPLIVTAVACIVGNILGYTLFKDVAAGMYYGSYSLTTYKTNWNGEAFILTTIIPFVIMLVVNLIILVDKLSLSPLKFIRRDLKRRERKKAIRLPKFRFFTRFRLRIIFQNTSSYVILFVGIIFANLLLLFGMMLPPLLTHYQDEIVNNLTSKYQYILKQPEEIKDKQGEKFCLTSLKTLPEDVIEEDIGVYGIEDNSRYIKQKMDNRSIYVSDGYADKYGLKKGATITLKDPYSTKKYHFNVSGIIPYPSTLTVFMSRKQYCKTFGEKNNYFNGYFSNQVIKELSPSNVAAKYSLEDYTKVSRQLEVSMGDKYILINVFSIVLFMLLIFLLTKLIIEKNATSISMVKILGYENLEIARLYLLATTAVVVISTIISLPIVTCMMSAIYKAMMSKFNGWLTLYFEPNIYVKMIALCIGTYLLIAALQFKRIKEIHLEEALKNQE